MDSSRKIVFTGPVGSGKTTAVQSLGGGNVISTNEKASDMVGKYKSQTTVAMDYGLMSLKNGERIRVYGTPGQERFDFMWDIIIPNCNGLVLLLDNSKSNPLQDLKFFICKFREYSILGKLVIGVTKNDIRSTVNLDQYRKELNRLGNDSTVHMVDARNPNDMMNLVDTLSLFNTDYLEAGQSSSNRWL